MRITHLLRYGLAAGAAAGLAAALVMYVVVEPVIRRALVVEDARDAAGHVHPEELVSRTAQVVAGLGTTVVVGMLFGLVFTVVFAKVRHRLSAVTEQGRAVQLALLGYAVFVAMPALTIPANPPAVGEPATVTRRTLIYLLTVLVSLLVAGAMFALDQRLRGSDLDPALRRCATAAASVAAVVLVLVVMPASPDRIPSDVPAALVWDFRLASLAQLGALWGVLGLAFGTLLARRTA